MIHLYFHIVGHSVISLFGNKLILFINSFISRSRDILLLKLYLILYVLSRFPTHFYPYRHLLPESTLNSFPSTWSLPLIPPLPLFIFQKMDPKTFSNVDFKYVDGQPDNQLLKGLKVWPVTEVRTAKYGTAKYGTAQYGTAHTFIFMFYDISWNILSI